MNRPKLSPAEREQTAFDRMWSREMPPWQSAPCSKGNHHDCEDPVDCACPCHETLSGEGVLYDPH